MNIAILCSGQGGQHRAMFRVTADAPESQQVFAAAKRVLGGTDPRQLVLNADEAELRISRVAQVLCCTQALAAWAALDSPAMPAATSQIVIAGYSVGELAAWGCAGLLDASTVLELAVARSAAMDAAAGLDGGLAAVRGLSRAAVDGLCCDYGAEIAIINGFDSFVVGGYANALAQLVLAAATAGASRAVLLPVAIAAHTARLGSASQEFRERLVALRLTYEAPARTRLLSGVDGSSVIDIATGVDKLAAQISRTIQWQECLVACREAGAMTVLELGPGRQLASMALEAVPGARCRSVDDFRSMDGVRHWLSQGEG